MKVGELKIGMLLKASPGFLFLKVPKGNTLKLAYVSARSEDFVAAANISRFSYGNFLDCQMIYLGTRSDLGIAPEEFDWSDKYVMIEGEVTAVSPSSWRNIEPVLADDPR